jgi:signal peptidase I
MKEVLVSIADLIPIISEKINKNEKVLLKVRGSSMEPFLHSNVTTVTLVKPEKLNRFDIILFKDENNTYLLHRIIKIHNDIVITMGDGNTRKESLHKDQIIAVVNDYQQDGMNTSMTNKKNLFKVRVWYYIRPFRKILLKLRRFLKRGNQVE